MARVAEHAIVIGAGMGGLAAAAAAAPFFDRVTILDRDALPDDASWRIGAPQCRHAHALLLGGLKALGELLPDFQGHLAAAGATPVRLVEDLRMELPGHDPLPQRDVGLGVCYTMTRPLLELVTRRRVEAIGNVEVRARQSVRGLEQEGPRVCGVRVRDGEAESVVGGDLVIDASGRGAATMDLLRSIGHPLPDAEVVTVNASYASVLVRKPPGWVDRWKMNLTQPQAPAERRGGFCFAVENDCWIVSLIEMHGDEPPEDWESFLAILKTLRTRTIWDAVSHGEMLGEVMRFKRPTSTRRRFDQLAAFPRGLVAFGDAVAQFNPIYGQGMTVSALQALALRATLAELSAKPDPLAGLAEAFFARTPEVVDGPWGAARGFDFQYPQTGGEKPADHEQSMVYGAGLARLAEREPDAHRIFIEVGHCARSGAIYQDPDFAARVMSALEPA
jgi:2-polyprenyl-6-methoxyphenol hydroxylase-like FAD-dependent oxidoreductase